MASDGLDWEFDGRIWLAKKIVHSFFVKPQWDQLLLSPLVKAEVRIGTEVNATVGWDSAQSLGEGQGREGRETRWRWRNCAIGLGNRTWPKYGSVVLANNQVRLNLVRLMAMLRKQAKL